MADLALLGALAGESGAGARVAALACPAGQAVRAVRVRAAGPRAGGRRASTLRVWPAGYQGLAYVTLGTRAARPVEQGRTERVVPAGGAQRARVHTLTANTGTLKGTVRITCALAHYGNSGTETENTMKVKGGEKRAKRKYRETGRTVKGEILLTMHRE